MSFRRKRGFQSNLKPINSRKNIKQDVVIIATGTDGILAIADTVDVLPAIANTNNVTAGSRINTVYLEVWIFGNTAPGVNSAITWYVAKNPGNNLTLPDPSLAGADDNKRWIYAMGKGQVGQTASGSPPYLIRGWFSLPQRMRRFGHDDQLELHIKNDSGANINVCRLAVYKWYF